MKFKEMAKGMLPAALAALCLLGCTTTQGNLSGEPEVTVSVNGENVRRPLPFKKLNVPKAEMQDESPLGVEKMAAVEPAKAGGEADRKLSIPQRTTSSRPTVAGDDYPAKVIKGIKDPDAIVHFEINLDNAQITEMVTLFADKNVLNFSYLVDPAVKGSVTVNIKADMKARDIWTTMQHLLWLSGAYASPSMGFINVLPFDKMAKERGIFATHEAQANVEVLFVPIRYKKSADIINLVKPFLTDGATIQDLTDSNTVIIVEAPANVSKLQELIKYLDNKGEREWPVRCFQCREVEAETLAAELLTLLPVLGMPVAANSGPSGGAVKVTALPRTRSVVVSASLEEILNEVAGWVKILDRSDMLDQEEIFFYNVRHSKAESLTGALEAFFNTTTTRSPTSSSSSSSRTSSSARTTSTRTTNNTSRTTTNARTTTNNANKTAANGLQATLFDTAVTVYSDDESNRLTIKTTARTWNMIKAFLERQDVPPRQVSIRAIITDINLTEDTKYGISYSIAKILNQQNTLDAMASTAGVNVLADSTLGEMVNYTGLGVLFKQHSGDPLAFVKAVAGDSNTRILSEPHILALSGATAKISVGEKIAVPTETTTYTSSDNMRSNYQYVDTGIIMEVTPYITAGNEVRLEISQEVSSAQTQTDPTIPPTIVNKVVSSELLVPDNSTLLMGGMIQTKNSESHIGIPLLKDIPYLGRLFSYNSYGENRIELLILLTVNVIDNKNPQEELIRRYKASLEEIEKANRDKNMY